MAQAGFWDNQESAQATVAQLKSLGALVKPMAQLCNQAEDIGAHLELADDDPDLAAELPQQLDTAEELIETLELKGLLNGSHDADPAILSVHARDGGTDANDWADMLLRMYTRWADANDYSVELLDRQDAEIAGVQSASILIRGPFAYGYLKGETGVHRLVRISPFNADGKRQTSFTMVDVSPDLPDNADIEIRDEDVELQATTSSGPGGQHVNKTASAVRLTHTPTGTVVFCQAERSQHKNRALAMKMLRAQLARLEEEKREAEEAAKYKQRPKTGFGSQIRNYFQHPDQRVKDSRTGYMMGNFQAVLDGDIQGFLDSVLRWRVGQESS